MPVRNVEFANVTSASGAAPFRTFRPHFNFKTWAFYSKVWFEKSDISRIFLNLYKIDADKRT